MNGTLKRLDTVHAKLSQAIRTTNPDLFSRRPSENEWSIVEVVHHLCLVEERVLTELKKSLQTEPATVGFLKKLIPMRIVSLRLTRVEAPKAVTPNNPPPMDELLQTYDTARADLKKFCTEQGRQRLKAMAVKHPVFGYIDGTAAVSMVRFHEDRHYKQIREIIKKLGASN